MRRGRVALVALLALTGFLPPAASAQVLLASEPHPDFTVGPLFVIATVIMVAGGPQAAGVLSRRVYMLQPRVGAP